MNAGKSTFPIHSICYTTHLPVALHLQATTSSISHSINDPGSINDKDACRVTLTCAASSLYYKYTSQTYKRLYKHISNSLFLHLLLLIMYGIIPHIGHTHPSNIIFYT